MDDIPQTVSDLQPAEHSFTLHSLPSEPDRKALVISFDGEAGNSREHFCTFALMRGGDRGGGGRVEPAAVVLDLRRLTYEWGDNRWQKYLRLHTRYRPPSLSRI